jgi:hypothetical protein
MSPRVTAKRFAKLLARKCLRRPGAFAGIANVQCLDRSRIDHSRWEIPPNPLAGVGTGPRFPAKMRKRDPNALDSQTKRSRKGLLVYWGRHYMRIHELECCNGSDYVAHLGGRKNTVSRPQLIRTDTTTKSHGFRIDLPKYPPVRARKTPYSHRGESRWEKRDEGAIRRLFH